VKHGLLITMLALAACGGAPGQVELAGQTMGTQFSIKLPAGTGDYDRTRLQDAIEAVLDGADGTMSTYKPDSALSTFNTAASIDWQVVSVDLCDKVEKSLAISAATHGSFDITVGPLVNLWGFGPEAIIDEPPGDEAIAARAALTGFDKLHADCSRPALRKDIAGLMLDMSAIGKGFAADSVADLLTALGFDSYLVEIGGELRVRGLNSNGEPWAIGIEAPLRDQRKPYTIVHLTDIAMATSGDYRNYFEVDGKIYSHTIDTRTGRPVTHSVASVTVVDELAYRADALATALLVMGPEEGMAFAERQDLAVLMLLRTSEGFEERQSPAFARLRDS